MSVTRAQVESIAALARLSLRAEEPAQFAGQLATILDHALELEQTAAQDSPEERVEPPAAAPLRDDVVHADALTVPPSALAPSWRDGFFTVPRLSAMQLDPPAGEP